MLTKGVQVFFLKCDEIKTGEIKAVITEIVDEAPPTKRFKIATEHMVYDIEEHLVSASIEGLMRFLFERYQATAKPVKSRSGKVQKSLYWDKVFPHH